ncbi:inflammatory response [Desmophyllum pertusum]|uniref:Inflammatory response n=1 Tax=Desmophyllum pertusum TaxID=174260 RepID=A0A9W9ZJ24_9CNID|nr:inflammatory response [Desmophyllum pertusum]
MSDNTQEAQVSTKINAKQQSRINQKEMADESGEESSQGKKPLPFIHNNSNVFVGIQVLQLGCAVGDRGASFIADGLRRNSTLRSLSLANCEISPVGLADIFQALSGNRYLKHLCVKGNHYDPSNCDSLAEMLVCNNTLTDLDLGSCDLRGLSKKVIHALCINNTLTSLKLARNGLGNADMSALSQVFSHPSQLSKLTKLDLSFNFIFPESLSVLASSLQRIRPRKLDELKLTQSRPCPAFHQVLLSLHSVVQNVIVEYLDPATLLADFVSQM